MSQLKLSKEEKAILKDFEAGAFESVLTPKSVTKETLMFGRQTRCMT